MADIYRDFSGRDFTARFEVLLERLKVEVPELTDFNHSDAGISLLRLLAREADQLNFYLDEAFNEGFIPTARFKQSLIDIAALTDYPPKLASAAVTTLQFTRDPNWTGDITIPQYSEFQRPDGTKYTVMERVVILSETDTATIPAVQGERVVLSLSQGDFERTDYSPDYKINLGTNVASGTIQVVSPSLGYEWNEVDSLWRSGSTDRHFTVRLYADEVNGETDTVILSLGDGTFGTGATDGMEISFIRCDGPLGNCGSGMVITAPYTLVNRLECTNITPASGGAYAEGVEEYRFRLPAITRTQRRMVIREDYETMVKTIPGVADCQAVDRTMGLEWPHLYIGLFILPEGGDIMSNELRSKIMDLCRAYGHLGSWDKRYILHDAIRIPVPIVYKLEVLPGYSEGSVIESVNDAIRKCFLPINLKIGDTLSEANLYKTTNRVPGVSWIEIESPAESVPVDIGEVASIASISHILVPINAA